jgi:hypothetical protein
MRVLFLLAAAVFAVGSILSAFGWWLHLSLYHGLGLLAAGWLCWAIAQLMPPSPPLGG